MLMLGVERVKNPSIPANGGFVNPRIMSVTRLNLVSSSFKSIRDTSTQASRCIKLNCKISCAGMLDHGAKRERDRLSKTLFRNVSRSAVEGGEWRRVSSISHE